MPIEQISVVLKAEEATTDRLNSLLSDGYEIKEKIRLADGTDSLILIKKAHKNVPSNAVLQHQAAQAAANRDPSKPQPMGDAKAINSTLDAANKAAAEQRKAMTKTFNKKK